jgi:hypothetical protein
LQQAFTFVLKIRPAFTRENTFMHQDAADSHARPPRGHPFRAGLIALALGLLAACQSTPPAKAPTAAMSVQPLLPSTQVVGRPYTGTVADWPLFFTRANWGHSCFNVQACMVTLGTWEMKEEKLEPRQVIDPTQLRGYPDQVLRAGGVGVAPFEEQHAHPARVLWRAKDGTVLRASIDILDIFKNRLIRHETPREDVSEIGSIAFTEIILEVNDRTIHVYTRSRIPTKLNASPGNPPRYSSRKLIKVFSQTF